VRGADICMRRCGVVQVCICFFIFCIVLEFCAGVGHTIPLMSMIVLKRTSRKPQTGNQCIIWTSSPVATYALFQPWAPVFPEAVYTYPIDSGVISDVSAVGYKEGLQKVSTKHVDW